MKKERCRGTLILSPNGEILEKNVFDVIVIAKDEKIENAYPTGASSHQGSWC